MMRVSALVALVVCLFAAPCLAEREFTIFSGAGEDYSYESFLGLDSLGVRVVVTESSGQLRGYTSEDSLVARIERGLRRDYIGVLSEEEWSKNPRAPMLNLAIDALADGPKASRFCVNVVLSVHQKLWVVTADQKPFVPVAAETWKSGTMADIGVSSLEQGGLDHVVDERVDEFLAAWDRAKIELSHGGR